MPSFNIARIDVLYGLFYYLAAYMIRRYLLSILLLSLVAGGCKKDLLHLQRIQQLNSGTTNTLYRIHFTDANTCFISGGDTWTQTTVIQSGDGGFTFHSSTCPDATVAMQAFSLSSFGTMYMCGVKNKVISSKDTGKTWEQHDIPDYADFYEGFNYTGIGYQSPDTGIAVSTHLQQAGIITTVDSNLNIISQTTLKMGLNDVYSSRSCTYVIGYGGVLKSTDALNWNFLNVKGDNFMAMDIHGDEIWMCGYIGCVYHSIDGGNNWERLRNGNDITIPHYNLMSIVFKDELNGWASCDDGRVIHTDDGGHHWEEYDRFTTNSLRSIVLCPNGDLLASGDNGALYRITP